MTQHDWLLSPLFTGIFVTLGIILFFQLLARTLMPRSTKKGAPINYLVGNLAVLSTVYFSALAIYFEIAAAQQDSDIAFIDFRLLLLSYVIIFLGRRTSFIVILCSFITRFLFWGSTTGTFIFIAFSVFMYLIFALNLHLIRRHHSSQLVLVNCLNIIVGVFWLLLHYIRLDYLGDIPLSQVVYYWIAFGVMNFFLYYGLTQLNTENDYLNTLTHQATIDPLTQLKNYAVFKTDFTKKFGEFHSSKKPLAMIALDIDYFKRVNDQYGHLAGNKILIGVGKLLIGAVHDLPDAHCYRVGGEEFNVLLPNISLEQASQFSHDLQAKIRQATFQISENQNIKITVSMGVSTLHASDKTQNLFYERTDQMLYHSKGEGRDRVTVDTELTKSSTTGFGNPVSSTQN